MVNTVDLVGQKQNKLLLESLFICLGKNEQRLVKHRVEKVNSEGGMLIQTYFK